MVNLFVSNGLGVLALQRRFATQAALGLA
jgi:hypothetical protein